MQKSGVSLLSIWFHTIAVENSIQIVSECCKAFCSLCTIQRWKKYCDDRERKVFFKKRNEIGKVKISPKYEKRWRVPFGILKHYWLPAIGLPNQQIYQNARSTNIIEFLLSFD